MPKVRIDGTEIDQALENGEWPDRIVDALEELLVTMKDSPGDSNENLTIEIVNDFEPEEDEDESTEETEPTKEA